jgi:microcystin-dependent protein
LCNGSNSTPDLRSRFVVGYNPDDVDYSSIGQTGGEKEHTLTVSELPPHTHKMNTENNTGTLDHDDHGFTSRGVGTADTDNCTSCQNAAHENRPPYYVLAFIMRVQ